MNLIWTNDINGNHEDASSRPAEFEGHLEDHWRLTKCTHRSIRGISWTALLVTDYSFHGEKTIQKVVERLPMICENCIANSMIRSAWWVYVASMRRLDFLSWLAAPNDYTNHQESITGEISKVVPKPTPEEMSVFLSNHETLFGKILAERKVHEEEARKKRQEEVAEEQRQLELKKTRIERQERKRQLELAKQERILEEENNRTQKEHLERIDWDEFLSTDWDEFRRFLAAEFRREQTDSESRRKQAEDEARQWLIDRESMPTNVQRREECHIVLGIEPNASIRSIKNRYRELA